MRGMEHNIVQTAKRVRAQSIVVLGFPSFYLFLVQFGILPDPLIHDTPSDAFSVFADWVEIAVPWVLLLLLTMMQIVSGQVLKDHANNCDALIDPAIKC